MLLLAHFTPAEIPGTLAVLFLGLSIGGLVVARRAASTLMVVVAISLVIFAFLGYTADVQAWDETVKQVIDVIFLVHAVFLFALTLRERRPA
jgi:CHASE2 domain-containing sensor protein